MKNQLPIFDGHNDFLLRVRDNPRAFFHRGDRGHIDLPRAREGGLAGGFCAVSVPADQNLPSSTTPEELARLALASFSDESTMPPTPELGQAQCFAMRLMARLFQIERESSGQIKVIRTADELEVCVQTGVFAALLHMEGAEPIDPDLYALEVFCQAGLRSLGLVWSRPNIYGSGVPFKFLHSPNTGPGLTDAGKELVLACNRLHIVIDLSHLNEQGFWDVARLSEAPLVATHSNAHALSPSTRNLMDKQLEAIKESDGIVGINFHVGFLRQDGQIDVDTPLDEMVRHVDYLVERLGIDRVAFGSDFDGAIMPRTLADAAGLPKLVSTLRSHGYDEESLHKLCYANWVRVLRKTWGA